jgi:hypothetical protein
VDVYSTQFYVGAAPTAATSLYTVPADSTAVVRDIEFWNGSGAVVPIQIGIYSARGAQAIVFGNESVPNNSWVQWQGRAVYNAGDIIRSLANSQNQLLFISGYLFQ